MSQKWLLCMYVIILALQLHVNKYNSSPIYYTLQIKKESFCGQNIHKMILRLHFAVTNPVSWYGFL